MTGHIATYSVKQASQTLEISVSTVRKYSLLLESLKYRISRDEQNARIFYDSDLNAFRKMKEATSAGRTLQAIAEEIARTKTETEAIKGNPPAPNDAQAISKLTATVEVLIAKIDDMAHEQEETRRAFQMALRKLDTLEAEKIEMQQKNENDVKTKNVFQRLFGKK